MSEFVRRAGAILSSPLFWGIVFGALLLVALYRVYRMLRERYLAQLDYDRFFSSDGVFRGDAFELTEVVHNGSLFPLFFVRLEFYIPEGLTIDGIACHDYQKLTSVFHLLPRSTVSRVHAMRADRRGHYELQNVSIRDRKVYFEFPCYTHTYIYPSFDRLALSMPPDLFQRGSTVSDRKLIEDPFFLSGVRAYRFGDPMRSINFKASARSFAGGARSLLCNSYDSSRSFDSMIFLDLTSYPEAGLSPKEDFAMVESGLRFACYLLCEAVNNGGRIGFSANCAVGSAPFTFFSCGSGNIHVRRILENFAMISYYAHRDYSFNALLRDHAPMLAPGVDLYIVTAYVDSRVAETLSGIRRMGRNVSVISLSEGGVTE